MKKVLPFSCLILFLIISLSSVSAIHSTKNVLPKDCEIEKQVKAEDLSERKLSFKEKLMLKKLIKKSKKNRGERSGDEGYAIASLVLGSLALLGGGFVLGIIAIVMAGIAFKRMRRSGGNENRGLAVAGLVMGIVATVLSFGALGILLLLAL